MLPVDKSEPSAIWNTISEGMKQVPTELHRIFITCMGGRPDRDWTQWVDAWNHTLWKEDKSGKWTLRPFLGPEGMIEAWQVQMNRVLPSKDMEKSVASCYEKLAQYNIKQRAEAELGKIDSLDEPDFVKKDKKLAYERMRDLFVAVEKQMKNPDPKQLDATKERLDLLEQWHHWIDQPFSEKENFPQDPFFCYQRLVQSDLPARSNALDNTGQELVKTLFFNLNKKIVKFTHWSKIQTWAEVVVDKEQKQELLEALDPFEEYLLGKRNLEDNAKERFVFLCKKCEKHPINGLLERLPGIPSGRLDEAVKSFRQKIYALDEEIEQAAQTWPKDRVKQQKALSAVRELRERLMSPGSFMQAIVTKLMEQDVKQAELTREKDSVSLPSTESAQARVSVVSGIWTQAVALIEYVLPASKQVEEKVFEVTLVLNGAQDKILKSLRASVLGGVSALQVDRPATFETKMAVAFPLKKEDEVIIEKKATVAFPLKKEDGVIIEKEMPKDPKELEQLAHKLGVIIDLLGMFPTLQQVNESQFFSWGDRIFRFSVEEEAKFSAKALTNEPIKKAMLTSLNSITKEGGLKTWGPSWKKEELVSWLTGIKNKALVALADEKKSSSLTMSPKTQSEVVALPLTAGKEKLFFDTQELDSMTREQLKQLEPKLDLIIQVFEMFPNLECVGETAAFSLGNKILNFSREQAEKYIQLLASQEGVKVKAAVGQRLHPRQDEQYMLRQKLISLLQTAKNYVAKKAQSKE